MKKIALDYDKTFSADPEFWTSFIRMAQEFGHEVRGVTHRSPVHDRTMALVKFEALVPVIYTNGVAKRWHCIHNVPDFVPDWWVDDKPESVLTNSETSAADLATWRADRGEGVSYVRVTEGSTPALMNAASRRAHVGVSQDD